MVGTWKWENGGIPKGTNVETGCDLSRYTPQSFEEETGDP